MTYRLRKLNSYFYLNIARQKKESAIIIFTSILLEIAYLLIEN